MAPSLDEKPMPRGSIDLGETGVSGLRRFGPYVYEEFLTELSGQRANKTYTEMSKNDPVIGAFIFAIKMLARQIEWPVEKFSEDPADVERAEFLESCFDDMEAPWVDVIAEVMSMVTYGWAWLEEVYKIRLGQTQTEPEFKSKYNDGRVGWRKLPLRSQDSFWQWQFSPNGDILAMIQVAPPDFVPRRIPIEKSLLFRTDPTKNNPEGYSVLRNAYRPWYFKKHIENIEAIGIERDLAGLPIAWVPPEILDREASDEHKQLKNQIDNIVRNLRRDEQEGVTYPLDYDENGNKRFDLTLLTTSGRRQFDTTEIVNRYDQRILMSVMADFLLLGHTKVGTFSLSSSKTELFSSAIGAWLDHICGVMNRVAIPRLFELNGFSTENLPKLTHGDIETVDLEPLGQFITAMANAGADIFPDPQLQRYLLKQAGLPVTQKEDDHVVRPTAYAPEIKQGDDPGIVPTYGATGVLMADCPNCDYGQQVPENGPFPAKVTCEACQQLYQAKGPDPKTREYLTNGNGTSETGANTARSRYRGGAT